MGILNLPNFKIILIAENEHDFQIQVETFSPPSACPHCGYVANLYKHDNRVQQLCMDLPIHGKRVGLLIQRQRNRCRECNQTFWERLDHTIDEKRSCTKRLLSYNIFGDYTNHLEKTFSFETPNWLGIDEIHIIKPRCVINNIEERTLVWSERDITMQEQMI